MKRIFSLFAAALAVLFSGCGPARPDAVSTALTMGATAPSIDDPLLEALYDTLRGDGTGFDVDTDATDTDDRRVVLTREVTDHVAELLALSPYENADLPALSGDLRILLLQNAEYGVLVQLFGCTDPDATVLWLQVGEESGQYTYDIAVYDEIEALFDENTVDNVTELTGAHTPLRTTLRTAQETARFLQFGDTLLMTVGASAETFDLETGASTGVFDAAQTPVKRIEKTEEPGWDWRAVTDGSIVYRSLSAPETPFAYTLPRGMRALLDKRDEEPFDVFSPGDPGRTMLAYTTSGGVYLQTAAGVRLLLGNRELPLSIGASDFEYAFASPRILCGGTRVSALIRAPGSQSGLAGIAVANVETGDVSFFTDVFSAMIADVCYPDGSTIAARGDDGYTIIDAVTGQKTRVEGEATVHFSPDLSATVMTISATAEDGGVTRTFADSSGGTLLTAENGDFWIAALTDTYAVCRRSDSQNDDWVVFPYR